eukprot:5075361-Prymnesium_polylepis.1
MVRRWKPDRTRRRGHRSRLDARRVVASARSAAPEQRLAMTALRRPTRRRRSPGCCGHGFAPAGHPRRR